MGRLGINNKIRQSLVANRVVSDNMQNENDSLKELLEWTLKMEKWPVPAREGLHSHAPPFQYQLWTYSNEFTGTRLHWQQKSHQSLECFIPRILKSGSYLSLYK